MSFEKMKYLPYVILTILALASLQFFIQKKYYGWIQEHWFRKPSRFNILSRIFYFLGFATLIISLLDLRGRPTKVESSIPDQKTIIIIDSSASMLVEDVRPNRFNRALLLARHFIKRSAGHQIAVVVFSDTQKRLIPFTDDLDLLDSRVAALDKIDLRGGGSQIVQAIQESVQYFKNDEKSIKDPEGNILLITDSEDNGQIKNLTIPDKINLAAVGVGTTKGGRIPFRGRDGRLHGYKRHEREDVVSKLDEGFLKKLGSFAKNYKYWIALSYNMPTTEILNFFGSIHAGKLKKGTSTVRPVEGHKIVITGIILLFIASVLNGAKSWSAVACLLFITLLSVQPDKARAQEAKPEEPQFSDEQLAQLEKMRKGNLNAEEKLRLADSLFQGKLLEEGITIVNEVKKSKQVLPWQSRLNLGNALCLTKKYPEGLKILSDLRSEAPDEIKKMIDQNVLNFMKQQKQEQQKQEQQQKQDQQQNKDDQQQQQDQQQNQDDQQKKDGEQGEDKQDKQGKGKSDQNQKDQKDKNKKDQKNEDEQKDKDKDKEKEKDNEGKEKEQQQKPQSLQEKEEQIRKNRKMVKVPAILKQIMSDDRNLQKKYWKTQTTDDNNLQKKDW